MKTTPLSLRAYLLACAAVLPLCAHAQFSEPLVRQTVLSENFSEGRTGWYGNNSGVVRPEVVSGPGGQNALAIKANSGTVQAVATYFTGVTLGSVGDSIRLSFDLTPSADLNDTLGTLRIALINSGSVRYTGDWGTTENPAVLPSALLGGYQANINGSSGAFRLFERTNAATSLMANSNGWATTDQNGTPVTTLAMLANNTYSISYQIQRTGENALAVTYAVSLGEVLATSTVTYSGEDLNYTFDTLAIGLNNSGLGSGIFTGQIQNVLLEKTMMIPEPSTYALFLGGLIVVGVLGRKRMRK